MSSERRRFVWVAIGLTTFFGFTHFTSVWLNDLTRGEQGTLGQRLIEEMTGSYAALPAFFLFDWMVRTRPLARGHWLERLPSYLGAIIAMGALHTTLMWASRSFLFPFFGLGSYDYGLMRYRYPMEFGLQAPSYLIIIALLHAWYGYRGFRQRELRTAQLEGELSRARLERLEAQLEPHFLFNTLNAATSLMYSAPARADQMLGRLSDLLRLTFRREEGAEVPLARELEWLEWYLEIMQLRFGDRLTIVRQIAPDTLGLAVPRLLLQPLVENALKHVAAKRAGPATVTVVATRAGDRLRLSVLDDGPGVADPEQSLRTGVGLSNTTERLRVLYGDAAGIQLSNREQGGLAVTVDLPVHHL